jgi:hypothetical protein
MENQLFFNIFSNEDRTLDRLFIKMEDHHEDSLDEENWTVFNHIEIK